MGDTVSLFVIVQDGHTDVRRCLSSAIDMVDQVVILDAGNQGRRIAQEFGAIYYRIPEHAHVGQACSEVMKAILCDWILLLHADEELAPGCRDHLRGVITDRTMEGYFLKISCIMEEGGITETFPDVAFRLFRNMPEHQLRETIFDQLIAALPRNGGRYKTSEQLEIFHRGSLYNLFGEDDIAKKNISLARAEVLADPENPLLRYQHGVALYRGGLHEEAASELSLAASYTALDAIHFPKMIRYIVLSYYGAEQYTAALDAVKHGLGIFSDYADLYYYGGMSYLALRQYKEACEYFLKAISMPKQPAHYAPFPGISGFRSYYQLGKIHERLLDTSSALRYYLLALRDNSGDFDALDGIVGLLISNENQETRSTLELLREFSTITNSGMGQLLYRRGLYGLALEYFNIDHGVDTKEERLMLIRGICCMQQIRFLEALLQFKKIPPSSVRYPLAKLNELLCFWLQGNTRRVRMVSAELLQMGLSSDSSNVVILLRDTVKKVREEKISLLEEGIYLISDIVARLLALQDGIAAMRLLYSLSEECIANNGNVFGALFLKQHRYHEAEHLFTLYLEQHPDCADTYFHLGEIRRAQGRHTEARVLYERAKTVDPHDPRAQLRIHSDHNPSQL